MISLTNWVGVTNSNWDFSLRAWRTRIWGEEENGVTDHEVLDHEIDHAVRIDAAGEDAENVADYFHDGADDDGDEVPGAVAVDLVGVEERGDAEEDDAEQAEGEGGRVSEYDDGGVLWPVRVGEIGVDIARKGCFVRHICCRCRYRYCLRCHRRSWSDVGSASWSIGVEGIFEMGILFRYCQLSLVWRGLRLINKCLAVHCSRSASWLFSVLVTNTASRDRLDGT